MISSPQNAKVKLTRALTRGSRSRREAGAFVAEGVRLMEEALASDWPVQFALYGGELSQRGRDLVARIKGRGIEADEISAKLLVSLSETETSQGVLGVLANQKSQPQRGMDSVLIADAIRDPGNLGTLLRTAEGAGFDGVFLAPGTTDVFSPKVVRAGMGAHFRVPLFEVKWEEIKVQAATYRWNVYLADMLGTSCWEGTFRHPLALIIGGEAQGASDAARRLASEAVSIPMHGKAESLNAAVAGSLLMFEVSRQRASSGGEEP